MGRGAGLALFRQEGSRHRQREQREKEDGMAQGLQSMSILRKVKDNSGEAKLVENEGTCTVFLGGAGVGLASARGLISPRSFASPLKSGSAQDDNAVGGR